MNLRSIDQLLRQRDGEIACGDAIVIRRETPTTLVAIIDALGHGERAAAVAKTATDILQTVALDKGVLPIMDAVHDGLKNSRGACALLCLLGEKFEGVSVGNVELRMTAGLRVPFVLTPGVLGVRVHRPRVFTGAADRRARFVAYSDGVSGRFHLDELADFSTADAARAIFEKHRRAHDDASLIVADVEP